jgi:hypothetical protein
MIGAYLFSINLYAPWLYLFAFEAFVLGAKNGIFFWVFPYVCPEPVLAKWSFLSINGSKMPFFAAMNLYVMRGKQSTVCHVAHTKKSRCGAWVSSAMVFIKTSSGQQRGQQLESTRVIFGV